MKRLLAGVAGLAVTTAAVFMTAAPASANEYGDWVCAAVETINLGVCMGNPLPERLPLPPDPLIADVLETAGFVTTAPAWAPGLVAAVPGWAASCLSTLDPFYSPELVVGGQEVGGRWEVPVILYSPQSGDYLIDAYACVSSAPVQIT